MMQITISLIVIVLAVIEAYGPPWLALYGLALPTSIVGLALACMWLPVRWVWPLAVMVGILLDSNSSAPFGLLTIYGLVTVWVMLKVQAQHSKTWSHLWWYDGGVVVIAASLLPLYATLLTQNSVTFPATLGQMMLGRAVLALPGALIVYAAAWHRFARH